MRTAEEWQEIVRKAGRAGGLKRAQNMTPEERQASAIKASKAAARARKKMTPKRRSEIAKKAADARWKKKPQK